MIARKMVVKCRKCGRTYIQSMQSPLRFLSMGLCPSCRVDSAGHFIGKMLGGSAKSGSRRR